MSMCYAGSGRPSTSTTDENIQAVKKMILKIDESLLQRLFGDVGISFAKITSHKHCSGDVYDVQWRSRFAQKGNNWWRIMGVWLWHWNQSPILSMEASPKNRKKHVKFGEMWSICSLFPTIAKAWCIMNSCHKVPK